MIYSHKFDSKTNILSLELENSNVEIDIETGTLTFSSKEKQKLFDWPGEYEIDDFHIIIFPSTDKSKNLIFIGREKQILVMPLSKSYSSLISEEGLEHIGNIDILIAVDLTTAEDEKKLIQMVEPRTLIKIGGKKSEKDTVLSKLSTKNLTFSEDSTNVFYIE